MKFRLATILNNIPVVYKEDDEYFSQYGMINSNQVPPRGVLRMVTLVPCEELITPIETLRQAVGFYDRTASDLSLSLDPSNLEAETSTELIEQISRFYKYSGTDVLEPTQRAWFANSRFRTAISVLFSDQASEILTEAFADLTGKVDNDSNES